VRQLVHGSGDRSTIMAALAFDGRDTLSTLEAWLAKRRMASR
jgi:hypothetical protein